LVTPDARSIAGRRPERTVIVWLSEKLETAPESSVLGCTTTDPNLISLSWGAGAVERGPDLFGPPV
jgi:hypothetical protein